MENILLEKDVILVNKIKYGPRLPRSPFDIPWLNLAFYFNDKAKKRFNENWWEYNRLSGTTRIKHGDVFVFNSTWSKEFILVKRCIALPGDTLNIKDAEIYTNNNLFIEPNSVKKSYMFRVKNKINLYIALDSLSNKIILKKYNNKFSEASLTKFQLEHLKRQKHIDSVSILIDTFNADKLFVKFPNLNWTFDNMGPIVVPGKGMQIELNPVTFSIYNKAINRFEDCVIKENNGLYYINNERVLTYIFKQDYFFMMGDNRKETLDSRKWGFIPESNIIGKVQCVLFSNYQNIFQWNRLLKSLN